MEKHITLTIGDKDVRFRPTGRDIDTYYDEITVTKKVVPSKTLLKRTVVPEDREALNEYLEAGMAIEIAAALVEEFQGDISITVKKSSRGSGDSDGTN